MITRLFDFLFGGGRNVLRDTAEVFVENAEAGAARDAGRANAAVTQFGDEFTPVLPGRRGAFDRLMDAVNRLPRPLMALGCLGLFISAMIDPLWFAARMQGIALVPEPLWWLLGVIVSFYFGARHQVKGQEFQRAMAQSLRHSAMVLTRKPAQQDAEENAALKDWRDTNS